MVLTDEWFEMSPHTKLLRENLEWNLSVMGNRIPPDEQEALMRVNMIVIRQCIEDMYLHVSRRRPMTPELEKVMNEAAIKNANGLRNLERDFSIGDFKAGFFLAIAHLEKQADIDNDDMSIKLIHIENLERQVCDLKFSLDEAHAKIQEYSQLIRDKGIR